MVVISPVAARFDPIALVEAAYDLAGDLPAWMDGLLECSEPALDRGMGLQGVLYASRENLLDAMAHVATRGGPIPREEMVSYLRQTTELGPPEGSRRIWTANSGKLRTLSEIMEGRPELGSELYASLDLPYLDHLTLVTRDTGPAFLMMGTVLARPGTTGRAERRLWSKLVVHISAGLRLRVRLASEAPLAREEAVLSADGRCLHAIGEARSARARLRSHAEGIDRARGSLRRRSADEALSLWRGLASGRWSLVDRWDTDGRRFVVARRNHAAFRDPRQLTRRELEVAERVARGDSNAEVGYALGLATSTVSTQLSRALTKLGLNRREELVALAAPASTTPLSLAGEPYVVRAAEALGASWESEGLTESERAVALLAAAGRTDREIASLRATSPRTVANQLRSVFTKLKLGSRAELAAKVVGTERPVPLDVERLMQPPNLGALGG